MDGPPLGRAARSTGLGVGGPESVNGAEPVGGTEVMAPLQGVLARPAGDLPRRVPLLPDREAGNEQRARAVVRGDLDAHAANLATGAVPESGTRMGGMSRHRARAMVILFPEFYGTCAVALTCSAARGD